MRLCSKCKRPVKGHNLPIGDKCSYYTRIEKAVKIKPDEATFYAKENRQMETCACCGRLSALKNIKYVDLYAQVETNNIIHLENELLERMLERLRYMDEIPQGVKKHYDLSQWYGLRFQILSSIPLDHRGVVFDGSECNVSLVMCNECLNSLKVKSNKKPPWASYANGWATGVVPKELSNLSVAETKMLRLGTLNFLSLCVAGRHNGVLSSHITTRMGELSPTELLPRNIGDSDVKVIFSNASYTDQELIKKKWLLVRRKIVCAGIKWLRKNSIAYANDVAENENLNKEGILESLVRNEDDNGELLRNVWRSGDRVANGEAVHESCVLQIDLSDQVMMSLTEHNKKNRVENLKKFLIRNKSEFANNKDTKFFGGTFPLRFPYGVGTPNCKRRVYVSRVKAYQRFLSLGNRSYSQDYEFLMYIFDEIARCRLHTSLFLKLRQNPEMSKEAVTLSTSDIETALDITSKRKYNAKRGCFDENVVPGSVKKALEILGMVQSAASHTFCTDEERLKMSRFSDSYHDRYGKPHGMYTFTPKENTSAWIAKFSGRLDGVSYDVIQNWKHPKFPSQKEIKEATSKDPVLAAIAFQKYIDEYVVPIFFGWDMENGISFPGGGEIGTVKAFLIPVESQGGLTSTLHGHALVWLEDMAATSHDEEADVEYNSRLCNFADEILLGSFPVLELFKELNGNIKSPCCVQGSIGAVDIPFICRTSLATHRPYVGQCLNCGKEFTSQDLRMEYINILIELANNSNEDLSVEQIYKDVNNIISADCLFPFPNPLPKYLEETEKKKYVRIVEDFLNYKSSSALYSMPLISESMAVYILDVIRLDIGIEVTHEHRVTVRNYTYTRFFFFDILWQITNFCLLHMLIAPSKLL